MAGTAFIEGRIFSKLFSDLRKAGWHPTHIDTGDEERWVEVTSIARTRREFESVEDATVMVKKEGSKAHGIKLIAGNGIDLICDYTFSHGDPDGFAALMDQITDTISDTYDR